MTTSLRPGRSGERVPDSRAELGADGDVLQVGRASLYSFVAALVCGRVLYAASFGDEFEGAPYVGAPELGQLAVLDDPVGHGMLYG